MKSYLAPAGLAVLQDALARLPDSPIVSFTGTQIGSGTNFIPNSSLDQAYGSLLSDKRLDKNSVKLTPVSMHEIICTTIIDRSVEYNNVGNVLFFANNVPMLWLVPNNPLVKLKTNPVTHFAGEKMTLSLVFRFPYINKLINFDEDNYLTAKFPVFESNDEVTVAAHTLSDQMVVDQNTAYYGGGKPCFGARSDLDWISSPIVNKIDYNNRLILDGGTTLSGQ
jgi:hypothetical protein